MKRRTFLLASTTSLIFPIAAQAYSFVQYTPAVWSEFQKSDETVILNFRANWSLTCNQKLELIAKLIAENPAYKDLIFIDVNWDTFGQSVMASRLKVKRQSTLIIMKQGKEVARIVNEPFERKMRAFLDTALMA